MINKERQRTQRRRLYTKAFKRSLQHSENYHGIWWKPKLPICYSQSQSNLVQQIRDNNYTLQRGDVTIRLAEAGVCFVGVERAVALYETRQHFPLSGSGLPMKFTTL